MIAKMLSEPVLIGAAIRAVILAGMAFGVGVTMEQLAAVLCAVEAVLALVTRSLVMPMSAVPQSVPVPRP